MGGAATSWPAPRGKLDLRRRAPLQSNPQDLNMKVQRNQKATQTSDKIKLIGVHMQHSYIDKTESENITQKQCREQSNKHAKVTKPAAQAQPMDSRD